LMIIGHAGHGKDTVCRILRDEYGMTFVSPSRLAAEKIIMPVIPYPSVDACMDDRGNHRAEWFRLISEYNRNDPARFIREIYQVSDLYCGCRSYRELSFARKEGLFRYAVWVDASHRLPPESTESCTVNAMSADYVLINTGDLDELRLRVDMMMKIFQLVRVSNARPTY